MPKPKHRRRIARQFGNAMIEYLVLAAVVAGIFALPFGDNPPLIVLFANAVGTGFGRFLSAMSLPL